MFPRLLAYLFSLLIWSPNPSVLTTVSLNFTCPSCNAIVSVEGGTGQESIQSKQTISNPPTPSSTTPTCTTPYQGWSHKESWGGHGPATFWVKEACKASLAMSNIAHQKDSCDIWLEVHPCTVLVQTSYHDYACCFVCKKNYSHGYMHFIINIMKTTY